MRAADFSRHPLPIAANRLVVGDDDRATVLIYAIHASDDANSGNIELEELFSRENLRHRFGRAQIEKVSELLQSLFAIELELQRIFEARNR